MQYVCVHVFIYHEFLGQHVAQYCATKFCWSELKDEMITQNYENQASEGVCITVRARDTYRPSTNTVG